jgi:hypothetical protein
MLCPTSPELLTDAAGRPYFLWDVAGMTLDELRRRLAEGPEGERAYWLAKVLRQAKPDDALQLVTPRQIAAAWPAIEHRLGQRRELWRWLLGVRWGLLGE